MNNTIRQIQMDAALLALQAKDLLEGVCRQHGRKATSFGDPVGIRHHKQQGLRLPAPGIKRHGLSSSRPPLLCRPQERVLTGTQ